MRTMVVDVVSLGDHVRVEIVTGNQVTMGDYGGGIT